MSAFMDIGCGKLKESKEREKKKTRGMEETRIGQAEREDSQGSECRHRRRRSTVPEMNGGMGRWVEGL
jgi:hypothetical protein